MKALVKGTKVQLANDQAKVGYQALMIMGAPLSFGYVWAIILQPLFG